MISYTLTEYKFSLTMTTYFCISGSLACVSPFTWETTNQESIPSLISFAPIYDATLKLTMKSSYSAWLLVVKTSKWGHLYNESSFHSRMRHAPFPILLYNPSVKTIHFVNDFEVVSVNSAMKYANTWIFRAFLGSK